eukprot:CAMPEP_0174287314 /NCGR_PEP_ID=MMETSP0809-20121228/15412_1 /TAXON_ID=73025 ORGANISM="Eutreptiella gymnastica-like, Strain CCMP1594" /NCGR_SAMPLE_ID=MMETSP0809 /ASSEMBLY_ACC=CAM_ASM_000658 /LENGTH=194 /DNA_ID=CAMNT_0015383823 /DNA_START=137 /DNA_END=718 /DNA_ORIENTATION=-
MQSTLPFLCFKNRIGFAVRHFHTHKSHGMKDGTPKDMDPGVQPLVASGFGLEAAAKMMSVCPELETVDVEERIRSLVVAGFARDDIIGMATIFPQVFTLDVEARISQLVRVGVLLQEDGFSDSQVRDMVVQDPRLLGDSVRDRVGPRAAALQSQGIGITLDTLCLAQPTQLFVQQHQLSEMDWIAHSTMFQDLW